ncbi:extradiol dioxygenase [Paraburkholderia caballeronis]|uniref:extradiol dioxygenase n=1 Tax=Paraburkholderia caballeronis TaxID=416943 RepID=UPI001066E980|nr:extradiol dioxygenase [Paraburkholderia caballeronis]TDV15710.1 hypothetical protein C7408_106167 [Paraburkholderia caballeronis]TDV17965.1 hypothetical protein C7406_105167 [Paraburkholderia caballeronis]TDV26421.1 hypothetical protein C7404_106124 [Paraburkholderia caballeronis]
MQLDHATIVTPDLAATVLFFTRVAGLTDGPRPPFGVPGHWLYSDRRPVLHLVQATLAGRDERSAPRIDHIAFRVGSAGEWSSLIERLNRDGIAYQIAHVPLTGERQLFVRLATSIVIEFVGALAP